MEKPQSPIATDEDGQQVSVYLSPDLTRILACAALATYTDFSSGDPPQTLGSGKLSFAKVASFTGFDNELWGSGKEEKYGLVYQSQTEPGTFIFAFRGTASGQDAVMDLESIVPTAFKPMKTPSCFPPVVHVGDGFYKIYASKTAGMPGSMQEQVFSLLQLYSPSHLFITGHSLGCPLGSMFALDVAVSQPTWITNINFASPRVGTITWKDAYDRYVTNQKAPNGNTNWTVRIVNNYDLVPKVPSDGFPTYFDHVGVEFPVSFTTVDYHFDVPEIVDSWHSLLNYQTVIDNAVVASPQGWGGNFSDHVNANWLMVSHNPFTSRSSPLLEQYWPDRCAPA